MAVVAIIGLLAMIGVPGFVKAREIARKNICISNLRILYHVMEEYMLETKTPNGATLSAKDLPLVGADGYIKDIPRCPYNSLTYGTLTTGQKPVCPNAADCPDHKL